MLYDHRTYTCRPGMLKAHMALYEQKGFKVQSRHLGKPLLWATTDVGDVNSYVHVWVYRDAADRAARRAAMWKDPEWLAYIEESNKLGALVAQENKILVDAPFMT